MKDELIYDGFRKSYPQTHYANSTKLKPYAYGKHLPSKILVAVKYEIIIDYRRRNPFTANQNLIKLPNQFDFNEQVCIKCVWNCPDSDHKTRKLFTCCMILDSMRNAIRGLIIMSFRKTFLF